MPNATDLTAILDGLKPGQLDNLPRATLEKLSDACYRAHVLCEQAAGQQAFSRVVRHYDAPKAAFLAELSDGRGRE
jgi:hypothetical protein